MSIFDAIAAFKGALLGSLLGSKLPVQRPDPFESYARTGSHLSYSSPFGSGHSLPERPSQGHSHPYPVCQYPLSDRPLRSLFPLG